MKLDQISRRRAAAYLGGAAMLTAGAWFIGGDEADNNRNTVREALKVIGEVRHRIQSLDAELVPDTQTTRLHEINHESAAIVGAINYTSQRTSRNATQLLTDDSVRPMYLETVQQLNPVVYCVAEELKDGPPSKESDPVLSALLQLHREAFTLLNKSMRMIELRRLLNIQQPARPMDLITI